MNQDAWAFALTVIVLILSIAVSSIVSSFYENQSYQTCIQRHGAKDCKR